MIIPRGGGFVDDYKLIAFKIINQAGCRIYRQRGSADNQDIGIVYVIYGSIQRFPVKPLFIQDNIGFYKAATFFTFGNACGIKYIVNIMKGTAVFAIIP